jgi:hypothetical protein
VSPTYAILWELDGAAGPWATQAGRLELSGDRVTLTGLDRALSFGTASVADTVVDQDPAGRIRGLPVLVVHLREGETVRIACLGGAGCLGEIAVRLGERGSADPPMLASARRTIIGGAQDRIHR